MKSSNNHYKVSDKGVGSNPAGSAEASNKVKVEVKADVDGWVFSCGKRAAGPFKTLNQADELYVAAFLSGVLETKARQLEALIERSIELERLGREDEAMLLDGEYQDEIEGWPVHPKDVFKAKLLEYAVQEKPQPKRKGSRDFPVFPPSLLAVCFKRRFFDVGDCDDFGCQYLDWCILQLGAIRDRAVLLFYEKHPTKCSMCHRRKATRMFFVERGARTPKSLFVTCEACKSKLPQHWKILKKEDLPLDY